MTENNQQQVTLRNPMTLLEKLRLLGASIGLALVSVALPFFSNLATSLQSQNLYIGYAFSKGQAPYLDLLTTEGFLYHALTGLAENLGGSYWLIPLQAICFYVSGIYLYKISIYLTQKTSLAHTILVLFFFLNLVLGFGGLYPIQFATPLMFIGIWILLTYFDGMRKDEVFIFYGLAQGLSLFFEPKTLIFWLLAFFVLTISNLKRSLFGRGFYQTLSLIFGFLLISYSLGYFILNMQLFLPYLQQTIIYNFTHFRFNHQGNWWRGISLLLVFLSSGFAPVLANFWSTRQDNHCKNVKTLLKLSGLIYLFLVILSQNIDFFDFLMILPFFLPLTALWLKTATDNNGATRRQDLHHFRFLQHYLKSNFYLPLILLVVGLARPAVIYGMQLSQHQDRHIISTYLLKQVNQNDKIYVWDDSTTIYRTTGTLSSSQFALPTINTATTAHQKLLTDELLQFQATYLIINPALPFYQNLDQKLLDHYEQVTVKNLSTFMIYKLKN